MQSERFAFVVILSFLYSSYARWQEQKLPNDEDSESLVSLMLALHPSLVKSHARIHATSSLHSRQPIIMQEEEESEEEASEEASEDTVSEEPETVVEAPAPTGVTPDGKFMGKAIFFHSQRGYGFIERLDGEDDIFVHQNAIQAEGRRDLAEGEEVEFNVIEENGQIKAIDVTGPGGVNVKGAPLWQRGKHRKEKIESGTWRGHWGPLERIRRDPKNDNKYTLVTGFVQKHNMNSWAEQFEDGAEGNSKPQYEQEDGSYATAGMTEESESESE
jgi:cold shock CspA family protein|mmetsp:Transcript_100571/g.159069  ORF Transcript_100571/g.159069 Transcript_100571/m.159069 type:complete len:273 (-) Transcript_100571:141-959(-)